MLLPQALTMKKYVNPVESLIYTTVMLTCSSKNGISTGTGFFYKIKNNSVTKVFIVTNIHVIENSKIGYITLTLSKNGKPLVGQKTTIKIDGFGNKWIKHPEVDLAIMDFTPYLEKQTRINNGVYIRQITKLHLARNNKNVGNISSMEDIIMIGYPNGIRDEHNNLPVIRRGITATNPLMLYNGKTEFLIDAACYPGSSGSPVFIANIGSFLNDEGILCYGNRIALLGILYAGFQHTAEGQIKAVPVPSINVDFIESHIPNNLGIVIDADRLLDFDNLL